jgi:hypothetical protein
MSIDAADPSIPYPTVNDKKRGKFGGGARSGNVFHITWGPWFG